MRQAISKRMMRIFGVLMALILVMSSFQGITAKAGGTGKQEITEKKYSGDGYEVTFKVSSRWPGAFNGNITIKNTGNKAIEDWYLAFDTQNQIQSVWNAVMESQEAGSCRIKNAGWNQDIGINESVNFGFTAAGDMIDIPDAYTMPGTSSSVEESEYSVNYTVDSDWGRGFTGKVEIKNKQEKAIEDWYLEFDLENRITGIWDADIVKQEESHYTVKNAGHNQNVASGASVTFGFTVSEGDSGKVLKNARLYSYNADSQGGELLIDTAPFQYVKELDLYTLGSEKPDAIRGSLDADRSKVKSFTYRITDDADIVLKSGSIDLSANWKFTDFGFVLGTNVLTVEAQMDNGNSLKKSMQIEVGNWEYAGGLDLDTDDNDGDGLINYLEDYYKTDKENADTDGDGLNDFMELAYIETNPLKMDSDDNGIPDGKEDRDKDGLENQYEAERGLDPAYSDSDFDNVNDYDEIMLHKTDPLNEDTDGDGADDGWEIENSTDPLTAEKEFTITKTYTSANQTVVPSVTVSNVAGGQAASLTIEEVSNNMLLNDTIPGYIGSAYEFNINGAFDTAELSFEFDKSLLSDKDFVPAIYHFDEESQLLLELENQKIVNNTVTAEITHFSSYILLNKTKFEKVWEEDIKSPEGAAKKLRIAFVVDVSGSMSGTKMDTAKTVIKNFIDILEEEDQAAIIKFHSSASALTKMTSDKAALTNGVNNLYASGLTAIYTGVDKALDEFSSSSASGAYDTIIVLTDGYDEPSTTYERNYAPLVKEALEKNITIYTVGIGTINEPLLKNVAERTGGKYYLSSRASDLEECFDLIKGETIDFITDSNDDGISDYFTKLMCDGKLVSGTGIPLFQGIAYEAVQADKDYDKDSLTNGGEAVVTMGADGKVYLKLPSSPVEKDTDQDGLFDNADTDKLNWNVCARDLAIFSALAYEDGTNFVGGMYQAADIKDVDGENGQKYYFLSGANLEKQDNGIQTKWSIVDYANDWADLNTYFSATTYRNGNNIVIAYRGTNEKIGEWLNNIIGVGLLNYHSEESAAKKYALKIADKYPSSRIYITGHSLGGYLAQLGAAELLENRSADIEEVSYFNGIGLKYNKLLFWTKDKAMEYLKEYNKKGTLISYLIYGDVVSSLGTHSGQKIGFYASNETRVHHAGKHGTGVVTDLLSKSAVGWLCILTGKNLAYYYDYYKVQSVKEYFWLTHETDSFYYYLNQGGRSKGA